MYGVASLETMNLVCDVHALPGNLVFHWRFNNSNGDLINGGDYDLQRFVSNGTRSVLSFSPMTPRDYGTILCFANNEVGRQREACVFHIVPAGRKLEILLNSVFIRASF